MGFSQKGTVTKDTTKVVISSEIARQIAKDLVRLEILSRQKIIVGRFTKRVLEQSIKKNGSFDLIV